MKFEFHALAWFQKSFSCILGSNDSMMLLLISHNVQLARTNSRCVQKKIEHLFRARILTIKSEDNLPKSQQKNRRKFLLNLGSNVADIVKNQFGNIEPRITTPKTERRVPERVKLLLSLLLEEQVNSKEEVVEYCSPDISVSDDCTYCPRCTGMCPTGAIKVRREKSGKIFSFDRRLCSACGLCAEFCKVRAISMSEARIRLCRTDAN
jgi:ferredoxin